MWTSEIEAADPDDLFAVYVSQGPLSAEVVRSKLEAEGVPAMLRYDAVGRAFGFVNDWLGRVQVCVRAGDAERALEIIAVEEAADSETTDEEAPEA